MFQEIRKRRLFFRTVIYTLGMVLFAVFFGCCWPLALKSGFWNPWLVCYGAGLAAMVMVEPFRHPKGSPYGFLLGGAARTAPPLFLVIAMLVTHKTVGPAFWVSLLSSYFVMLILVTMLTIPVHSNMKQGETGNDPEKNEENF